MTYIVFGFRPPVRDDNQDLDPANQPRLEPVELYRTDDYGEIRQIARSGGLVDQRGVFCPLVRVMNDRDPNAGDIVAAMPAGARAPRDTPLRKSEFDPAVTAQRNALGLRPLPQNSRPSRGEQPQTQDDVANIVEQSVQGLPPVPPATIHRALPGVTKPQES
jgi:hypothetical protein